NPAGVEAALTRRGVLANVGRGPAVLATEREPLQESQDDEGDWRGDPDRGVGREESHERGGKTHDHDRDQEGVLAAREVAEPAEEQRAKGAHEEAGRKCEQGKDESGGLVYSGEEL